MKYLLDTNICIYLIRRQPPEVFARLQAEPAGSAAVSVITYGELWAGIDRLPESTDKQRQTQALKAFFAALVILPVDQAVMRQYAKHRAVVTSRQSNALDRLIAAHAVTAKLILVTNNVDDFKIYPDLHWQNWTQP